MFLNIVKLERLLIAAVKKTFKSPKSINTAYTKFYVKIFSNSFYKSFYFFHFFLLEIPH